jgi:hypothetical protein
MLIAKATPQEICEFFGLEAWIGIDEDDRKVGLAGFRREEGRVWGFLDLAANPPPLTLIRAVKARLKELGEPVYVASDEEKHPSSPKLLSLLGFAPIDETLLGMRVWKCQV